MAVDAKLDCGAGGPDGAAYREGLYAGESGPASIRAQSPKHPLRPPPLAESVSPLAEALSAALTAVNPVEVAPVTAVADPAEPAPGSPATDTANPDPTDRKPVLSLKNRKATP